MWDVLKMENYEKISRENHRTIPGMRSISLASEVAKEAGMSFGQMLDILIEDAMVGWQNFLM